MPDAGQRLLHQATGNLQLITMLEVMHALAFKDAEHLMDAADETQALAWGAARFERMQALDPDGLVRQRLATCIDRAQSMHQTLALRAQPVSALKDMPARVAIGLNRLLQACKLLQETLDRHDGPFDMRRVPAAA